MSDLQHRPLPVGAGDDPLYESFFESVENLIEAAVAVLPFGLEARGTQRVLHRPGGGLNTFGAVGNEVDVCGVTVHDAVQDQGVSAAEHEPVLGGNLEGDGGYFPLEVADRHYAAAAARRKAGCCSSQACRTSLGRNRSGQTAISLPPFR